MGPRDDEISSDYRKMYEVSKKQKCFENNVTSSTCRRNASKPYVCMFQNMRDMRFLNNNLMEFNTKFYRGREIILS